MRRRYYLAALLLLLSQRGCRAISPESTSKAGFVRSGFFSQTKKDGTGEPAPLLPQQPSDDPSLRVSENNIKIAVLNSLSNLGSSILFAWMARSVVAGIGQALDRLLKFNSGFNASNTTDFGRFLQNVTLSANELELAASIVDPFSVETDLKDIGGLKDVKRQVLDCCTFLTPANAADSAEVAALAGPLYTGVRGILLYGPPGCGKTALVRAIAKKKGVPILPLQPSSLLRKFVGESSQLCRAVFSLAEKLSPCIVFVDEADSLFRARYEEDNAVDRNLKTEFMQLWDDLSRSSSSQVLIVGATNRPQDLDAAIQRRFERSFLVGMPDEHARVEIFRSVLKNTIVDNSFDFFKQCARATEGYSPSDLLNVCKAAAQIPLRELKRRRVMEPSERAKRADAAVTEEATAATTAGPSSKANTRASGLRPLRWEDVKEALSTVYPTSWTSTSYGTLSRQQQSPSHLGGAENDGRDYGEVNEEDDEESDSGGQDE